MPKRLTKLRIHEVSAVDRGAGEGVRVVLMKRDGVTPVGPKKLAKIEQGLKDAIEAVGLGKNQGRARAHILKQASSAGLLALIPEGWEGAAKKRVVKEIKKLCAQIGVDKAFDFNTVQAGVEAAEYGDGMLEELAEAVCSLRRACNSIMCDDSIADKMAALKTNFGQFRAHVGGLVPEGIEQALQAAELIAGGATVNPQGAVIIATHKGTKTMAMDEKELARLAKLEEKVVTQKARRKEAEGVAETLKGEAKGLKKRAETAEGALQAVMSLTPTQKAWLDHADNDMSLAARVAFAQLPTEKRDEQIAASPVEMLTEKRLSALPESVRQELEAGRQFRKMATEATTALEIVTLSKRAVELGMPESLGAHLAEIKKLAPAAFAEVDKGMAALAAQLKTNLIFKEFGNNQPVDANSAIGRMNARAEEIMKSDSKITSVESAIAKVAVSKVASDIALWREYKVEAQA